MGEEWHRVADAAEVQEDTPLSVTIDGNSIGIYRLGDDLHAMEDICPHAYALLSEGFIDGDTVECPLHEAQFHIPSGRCLREPGGRDLKSYPVKQEGGAVYVQV